MIRTEELAAIGMPALDTRHPITRLLAKLVAEAEADCAQVEELTRQAWDIVAELAAHCSHEAARTERVAHRGRRRHERAHPAQALSPAGR